MAKNKVVKRKRRPVIIGFFWLLLGLFLLAQSNDVLPPVQDSWPILIILLGVAFILGALFRGRDRRKETDQRVA
jgi:hypothetical protein